MTIYGLGGCGKSALVLEFAYRALAECARDLVFWVPAISRESFELAYREIATRLRLPGHADPNTDINTLVKEALSAASSGRWLMIVDNADDPTVLSSLVDSDLESHRLIDYLPHSRSGAVLFTTRSRKAARTYTPGHVLELKDMSQGEAKELLTQHIAEEVLLDDVTAISQLLSILACLPLAIVQAAAFINNNEISISDYVSLFQDASAEIELFSEQFEDPSRYREMDSTVAKTWHISFDQIRKQDPLAAEYLSFIACIDRINIPQSLLPLRGSAVQRVKALGTLTGYAFITERQQITQEVNRERFFDMHRLVHVASGAWLHEHGQWASWAHTVVDRLEEVVPLGGHEGKDLWIPYLSHAIHVAGRRSSLVGETARASLLKRVGQCQESLGQYTAAEISHRQASSLRKEVLGPEHPSTLTSMDDLALVLHSQGKYKEAEATNRLALMQEEKVLGREHPSTLMSMGNLAAVLDRQGKYKEAEAMNRQTLAQMENVLGREHPHTLMSMGNLAAVLDRQGKYKEAETMNRQTLAQKEKVLGREHPSTLMSMGNLAAVLDSQGKYEEAEVIYRRTLARRQKVLGYEHPSTLISMGNLAAVLNRQGKYKEAEAMNRQTLLQMEIVLGREHPDTLTSKGNLAAVLDRQGKHKEAEAMNRQTLAQMEKVLGLAHPDTLTSMNDLALVLHSQGKYEEADAIYRQTLARRQKVLGREHPHTLTSMNNLAAVLDSQGKYKEAEATNRQTLAQMEKVLGREHPDTLTSMNDLALVLHSQGKYEEAEALNRQTLLQVEKVLGREHPSTLASVYCLAHLLTHQHRYNESLALYERACAGYQTVLGKDHPTTRACQQHFAKAITLKRQG
jgi:tetratricopeptide (TPR) repeat protein